VYIFYFLSIKNDLTLLNTINGMHGVYALFPNGLSAESLLKYTRCWIPDNNQVLLPYTVLTC